MNKKYIFLLLMLLLISCKSDINIETTCQNSSLEHAVFLEELFDIKFLTSFEEAQNCSKISGRPILIMFNSYPNSGIKETIQASYINQMTYLNTSKKTKDIIIQNFIPLVLDISDQEKILEEEHYETLNLIEKHIDYPNAEFSSYYCNPTRTIGNLNQKIMIAFSKKFTIPNFAILDKRGNLLQTLSTDILEFDQFLLSKAKG